MPSTLTIQLLGEFRILCNGKSLAGISADRPQSLLAYLLLHRNAPQPRQHLAFLLWPDSSEAQARTNLRNLLFSLRKALPDADSFIASDTLTIQWRADAPFHLDVARFEEALQRAGKGIDAAARRALEEAVASYTGDLLPGNYDDWIAPLRAELRQRFLDALMRLIDLLEAGGDYRAAISANQRLIAQDPINERAYVQLMRLYALSGDRAGVRHVYQQCVAALERELEVGPSPSTTKAYEQLLRLQPQAAASAAVTSARPLVEESMVSATAQPTTAPRVALQPKPLQPPSTPFLGRQTELAAIEGHLRDPHCRLLTLVGLGGIGKTRLALHVAAQSRARFPDGIAFVPLAGVQDSTLIWQAIADALNLPLTSSSLPMQTVLHGLTDVSMLVVLDNMEQLLADVTPITELLAGAPSIKIVATSRERLNLLEEWVFAVTGLASSERPSSPLEESAATALFLQTARRTQSGFSPNAGDATAIRHICKLVDGMPLGIELAAAWVNMLSPAEIADEIERNLDFLATPARNVPERHRTMRAVFDQSWKLLTPTEQRLFRQLSVFRGGFVRPMAQRVADANLASLASLVDKSLLRWAANGRYELHERVRQYAYHKLHAAGEAEATHDRHLAALGEIEQRLRHDIYSAEQAKALDETLRRTRQSLCGAGVELAANGAQQLQPTGAARHPPDQLAGESLAFARQQ